MTVRELLRELSRHPPDALVIARSDESGFTDQIAALKIRVVRAVPPIAGTSHRLACDRAPEPGAIDAILIGAPETL